MATSTKQASSKRRLLLASDRIDRSGELASILSSVSDVDTVTTAEIPLAPGKDFAGVVVDINLRSPESVQIVRNRLRADAYSAVPRLFVLADALHHASMQAWALGATDTISRPFDARAILQRIRSAFPDPDEIDTGDWFSPDYVSQWIMEKRQDFAPAFVLIWTLFSRMRNK